MAQRIIWSPQARQDKKEIITYWKLRLGTNTYSRKLDKLFDNAISLISRHPKIGWKTDVENVRAKLVENHLIIYDDTNNGVNILTLWDTRRNPKTLIIKK